MYLCVCMCRGCVSWLNCDGSVGTMLTMWSVRRGGRARIWYLVVLASRELGLPDIPGPIKGYRAEGAFVIHTVLYLVNIGWHMRCVHVTKQLH